MSQEEDTDKQPNPSEEKPVKPWIHIRLEQGLEQLLRWFFFWETDDHHLGILIRFLHHSVTYSLILTYILLHTVYPSYFLLVLFTLFQGLIWLHHILTGGCLVSKVEQRLLKDESSFIDTALKVLGIPVTPQTSVGFVVFGSSIIFFMLCMEVVSRTVLHVTSFFSS
jgi:hypothetical protein